MFGTHIEPFYFDSCKQALFGCFHAPHSSPERDCGVVLCYPLGWEYVRFHRPYRRLAVLLSRAGFPVLRFDFYGCGDSSGNSEEAGIDQWLTDISNATAEIKRRSGVSKVSLVGLRMGGTLVAAVGARQGKIDGIVLWDPVIDGRAYLEDLRNLHQEMLQYAHVAPGQKAGKGEHTEILGYTFSDSLLADLGRLDLLAARRKPADHVLLIETHTGVDQGPLRKWLASTGAHVEYRRLPSLQLCVWTESFSQVSVPREILELIVRWMSGISS